MSVNQEYVERTLMVGHKHVALVFLQVLASFNLYRYQKHLEDNLSPHMTRHVTPEVAIAYGGTNAHLECCNHRHQHYSRQTNYKLVDSI